MYGSANNCKLFAPLTVFNIDINVEICIIMLNMCKKISSLRQQDF